MAIASAPEIGQVKPIREKGNCHTDSLARQKEKKGGQTFECIGEPKVNKGGQTALKTTLNPHKFPFISPLNTLRIDKGNLTKLFTPKNAVFHCFLSLRPHFPNNLKIVQR